jgi:hypothetical protein
MLCVVLAVLLEAAERAGTGDARSIKPTNPEKTCDSNPILRVYNTK